MSQLGTLLFRKFWICAGDMLTLLVKTLSSIIRPGLKPVTGAASDFGANTIDTILNSSAIEAIAINFVLIDEIIFVFISLPLYSA